MSNETKPLTAEEVKRRAEEYGNTYRMKLGEGRAAHAGYLQGYRDCQEQTAALREELQELSAWKKSQLETFSPLLDFGQSKESGIPIGASIVQEAINALKEQKVVREELQKVTQLLSQERELHDDVVSGLKYSLDSAKEELEAVKKEGEAKKNRYVELVLLINTVAPNMAEQFARHDYRSMWEIWQMLRCHLSSGETKELNAVKLLEKAMQVIRSLKLSMLAHPDHQAGSEFDDLTTTAEKMEREISGALSRLSSGETKPSEPTNTKPE